MFSQASVRPHFGGEGYPHLANWEGGTHPADGGTPSGCHLTNEGGTPIWLMGGVPPSGLDGGTPLLELEGVPPPQNPPPETEQQSEYLLCGDDMPLAFTQEDSLVIYRCQKYVRNISEDKCADD